MIYVTSDLHGRFDCLQELLKLARFSDEDYLFILGDVIDRNGKGGVDILLWLLNQSNVTLIRGNHEEMMLDCEWLMEEISDEAIARLSDRQTEALTLWQRNGATPTIENLGRLPHERVLDIMDYLRDTPFWDSVSVNGRDFLLVHGGLDGYREGKHPDEYSPHVLLWSRPRPDARYSEAFTTILGHTPTRCYGSAYRGRMLRTETWINIDTGAADGNLAPMLLRLDDMQEFYLPEGE